MTEADTRKALLREASEELLQAYLALYKLHYPLGLKRAAEICGSLLELMVEVTTLEIEEYEI